VAKEARRAKGSEAAVSKREMEHKLLYLGVSRNKRELLWEKGGKAGGDREGESG
jgi:hypothetical protein